MALIETVGDPTLTVGLAVVPIAVKLSTGEMAEVPRWSQTVIDPSDGEPAKGAKGNVVIGSPLAGRGTAR